MEMVSNQLKQANWRLSTSGSSKYRAVMKSGIRDLERPVHRQVYTSVDLLSYSIHALWIETQFHYNMYILY